MYYNIIPSFYGRGAQLYLNAGISISRHCRLFVKGSLNKGKEVPSIGVSGRFQLVIILVSIFAPCSKSTIKVVISSAKYTVNF